MNKGIKLKRIREKREAFVRANKDFCISYYLTGVMHSDEVWLNFIKKAREEIGYAKTTYGKDISMQLWKTTHKLFRGETA